MTPGKSVVAQTILSVLFVDPLSRARTHQKHIPRPPRRSKGLAAELFCMARIDTGVTWEACSLRGQGRLSHPP